MSSLISIECAVECVGRAIYGKDWIGSLTRREEWLIRKYVEGSANTPSSIIPGRITFNVGNRRWTEYPSDPDLVKEVERARDRADWMNDQTAQVVEWLEDHGFDSDARSFSLEALSNELKREFGKVIDGAEPPREPDDTGSTAPAASTEDQIIADTVSAWTPRSGDGGPHRGLQAEILRNLEKHSGVSKDTLKKRKPLMAKIDLAVENFRNLAI